MEKILKASTLQLLIVTQYFWPENFRVNDLVAELVLRGHDITVLTGYPNYPDGRIYPEFTDNPSKFSSYSGSKVVRIPMTSRGNGRLRLLLNYLTFALSASILGLWKLRGKKFDGIFVFEPSPISVGVPGAVMRRAKNAPMVFWVLDLWPETLQALGVVKSPMLLKLIGKLVSWVYGQCDLILAQSKSFVPQIRKYAPKGGRIEYFPSWAESNFSLSTAELAAEVEVIPNTFNVLFAGNIGEAQDFSAILLAAEKLRDNLQIRWLVLGDGRKLPWVIEQVKARGLESCVTLLGRFPLERMASFFKHADVLLVSLRDEPVFGLTIPGKIQSYLAAGIPIAAMLNGEGAQVIAEANAGLSCPAGDHDGLADIINRFSKMPKDVLRQTGLNGMEYSSRQFGREKLIGRIETIFENLLQERLAAKNHLGREK